jgi:outer membrane receptor protein involved in Fe transport
MTIRLLRIPCPVAPLAIVSILLCGAFWPGGAVWGGDLDQQMQLDMPAAALSDALRALAKQADLQVSFPPEEVAGKRSPALKGTMSARQALRTLLQGTDLDIIEQSAGSIAVRHKEPVSSRPAAKPRPPPSSDQPKADGASDDSLAEVIVTSRKRAESVLDVPTSISALSSQSLSDFKIQSFADYVTKIPNLSYGYGASGSYGVAGSRAVAIRGIVGANTTGFYIDDTPVYDSMDPRIVDVERIEVLKGPQGTLFGSRSMGGNVRIITKQPDVNEDQFSYGAQASYTQHGGGDYEADGIANVVITPQKLAVRMMAFYDPESGFITRTYGVPGTSTYGSVPRQGGTTTGGASIAALLKATDDLGVTFRLLYQRAATYGWPAAYAPLPNFEVTSLTTPREVNVQELATNRFTIPSLELTYRGNGWNLASSTSYSQYQTYDFEDGTEGIQQLYASFGIPLTPNIPVTVGYGTTRDRLTQESRVLFDGAHGISGVAGVYYSREHSHLTQSPPYEAPGQAASGAWPDNLVFSENALTDIDEIAGFGELYAKFLDRYTLTLGARAFHLDERYNQTSAGFFAGVYPLATFTPPKNVEHGVVPKVALQYEINGDSMVYASAAQGYRPGGFIPFLLPDICTPDLAALGKTTKDVTYRSDSIWSYELGGKTALADRKLLLTGSVFQANWSNIQQSIYLTCTFNTIINVGAARSRGAELELTGRVIDPLELRVGLGFNDAKITSSFPGSPLPPGTRILEVPAVTATVSARYETPIGASRTAFVTSDYSYTGDSLSENTSVNYPVTRPAYSMVNARIGMTWGKSELSLFGNNLTNQKANLGDLQFWTFRQSITLPGGQSVLDPRVAVSRPIQIGIRYQHAF